MTYIWLDTLLLKWIYIQFRLTVRKNPTKLGLLYKKQTLNPELKSMTINLIRKIHFSVNFTENGKLQKKILSQGSAAKRIHDKIADAAKQRSPSKHPLWRIKWSQPINVKMFWESEKEFNRYHLQQVPGFYTLLEYDFMYTNL